MAKTTASKKVQSSVIQQAVAPKGAMLIKESEIMPVNKKENKVHVAATLKKNDTEKVVTNKPAQATKKAVAQAPAKKVVAKKTAAKKPAAKKTVVKKPVAKKKPAAKKTVTKKLVKKVVKKVVKKTVAKKTAPAAGTSKKKTVVTKKKK